MFFPFSPPSTLFRKEYPSPFFPQAPKISKCCNKCFPNNKSLHPNLGAQNLQMFSHGNQPKRQQPPWPPLLPRLLQLQILALELQPKKSITRTMDHEPWVQFGWWFLLLVFWFLTNSANVWWPTNKLVRILVGFCDCWRILWFFVVTCWGFLRSSKFLHMARFQKAPE